ncbi:hypothetical protein B2G71_07145 [Novosphingobium sp. PC22D]|uniref:hypothetical protein n=1 Tax=Novosphingobium sp. PC22D TaxID=1962403 RepID=UPI000BEFD835|nr:hypothetical protein [Novosphingobium sp. PC22D]PEQ13211.1 hypothetical protein B2G71_07145 [Novosphingobium sp. PC22D]
MSVPPFIHPCWKRLATGGLQELELRNPAAQMMAKRLDRDQRTELVDRVQEIHEFFTRYERTLGHELSQFDRL